MDNRTKYAMVKLEKAYLEAVKAEDKAKEDRLKLRGQIISVLDGQEYKSLNMEISMKSNKGKVNIEDLRLHYGLEKEDIDNFRAESEPVAYIKTKGL